MSKRTTYNALSPDHHPEINFETKEEAEQWIKEAYNKGFAVKNPKDWTIVPIESKGYRFGEGWRSDFDYDGMLKTGAKASLSWGLPKLRKLYDSFESVNYHDEIVPLWSVLQDLEKGDTQSAKRNLDEFKKLLKKTLRGTE